MIDKSSGSKEQGAADESKPVRGKLDQAKLFKHNLVYNEEMQFGLFR